MSESERFEILVLGSGAGGKLLAWHMAQSGRRTAVVERRWIGGSCPNVNCMPSKNEIHSAKVASLVRHSAEYGARTGPVEIDMGTVRELKRHMVDRQIAAHLHNYETSGTELIMGSGRFVAPRTRPFPVCQGSKPPVRSRTSRRSSSIICRRISSCSEADTWGSNWPRPIGASAAASP